MGPSEWRDMRQEFGRTVESSFSPLSDSHPKLLGVPIDDDGGQQVQTRDAEVLTFSGAIADFALPPDPQCALQSMVGLAFVETYLGADLVVLDQNIDTSDATGRLLFNMLGAIGQFETQIRAERQMDGIKKAKDRGVQFGKRPALSEDQISELCEKRGQGILIKDLMAHYDLSKTTIYRYLGTKDT